MTHDKVVRFGKSDFLNSAVNREVSVRMRVENEVNKKETKSKSAGRNNVLNQISIYKLSFLQDFLKRTSRRENLNRI